MHAAAAAFGQSQDAGDCSDSAKKSGHQATGAQCPLDADAAEGTSMTTSRRRLSLVAAVGNEEPVADIRSADDGPSN